MITFVFGAPGTGKTHYIFDRLADNPDDAIFIVPEQQTVICERLMLERLPASAQLTTEVVNFTRLCNRVFREFGGLSYRYITPAMKSLLMWRTLRELSPMLEKFGGTTAEALTPVMLSAAEELRYSSVNTLKIDDVCNKINDPDLKKKLRDISLAVSAYRGLVAESFDDKAEDMDKLAEILGKHRFFKGRNVYIDSFTGFTAQELTVISEIFGQADNVTVTLAVSSPDTVSAYSEKIVNTAKTLFALCKRIGKEYTTVTLTENKRAKNAEIAALSSDIWKIDYSDKGKDIPDNEHGHIRVMTCIDAYDEADAAVAAVLSELKKGLRCRDIAIIARDAESYRGIIDTALNEAGVPCYLSEKTDITTSFAVYGVLSALKILCSGWRTEDVNAFVSSGFCGFDERDVDMFAEYTNVRAVRGRRGFCGNDWEMNPDGYSVNPVSPRGKRILEAANRIKHKLCELLVPFFRELEEAKNVRGQCTAVWNFCERADIAGKLRDAADVCVRSNDRRRAADILSVHTIMISVLDDIASAYPEDDIKLTDEEFRHAYRLCVSSCSSGSIPTGCDEVTIGSASLLRTGSIRCAVILGMNEGVFPAAVQDNGVFSDSDRQLLGEHGISLSDNSVGRATNELLYVRNALSLPSETLYIMYTTANPNGTSRRKSPAVDRVLSYFGYIKPELSAKNPENLIYDKFTAQRLYSRLAGTPCGDAVKSALEAEGICVSTVSAVNPECVLNSGTTDKLFDSGIGLSQSSIENYLACPFKYACEKLLYLRNDEAASIGNNVIGSFIHAVLEKSVHAETELYDSGKEPDESLTEAVISDKIAEFTELICTGDIEGKKRIRHMLLRLFNTSAVLSKAVRRNITESGARPEFYELALGNDKIPPLTLYTGDGTPVRINGKVDRVDIKRENGDVYIYVTDYKTYDKAVSVKDIANENNLQLLLYLFSLCRADNDFSELVGCRPGEAPLPGSAVYVSAKLNKAEYDEIPDRKDILQAAADSVNVSGIYVVTSANPEPEKSKNSVAVDTSDIDDIKNKVYASVVSVAEKIKSGKFDTVPNKDNCRCCKMNGVCRNADKSGN